MPHELLIFHCIKLNQLYAQSKAQKALFCMCICVCTQVRVILWMHIRAKCFRVSVVKQREQLSNTLQWLSLRGRVWHSLNVVFRQSWRTQTHYGEERWGEGVRVAKCIMASARLSECNISKHITSERWWQAQTVLMERRGQEGFCFISWRCVRFVRSSSADWVLTSAQPGYTNSPERLISLPSNLQTLLSHTVMNSFLALSESERFSYWNISNALICYTLVRIMVGKLDVL